MDGSSKIFLDALKNIDIKVAKKILKILNKFELVQGEKNIN